MSSIRASDAATVWRGLVRGYTLMIGFCWAVTALIVAITVTATTLAGDVTESLWLNTGSTYLGEWLAQELGLGSLSYGVGLLVALGSAVVVLAAIHGINRAVPIRPRKF